MAPRTIRLQIGVTVDGPVITGVVTPDGGSAQPFSGRLALIVAIERALDESPQAKPVPPRLG